MNQTTRSLVSTVALLAAGLFAAQAANAALTGAGGTAKHSSGDVRVATCTSSGCDGGGSGMGSGSGDTGGNVGGGLGPP